MPLYEIHHSYPLEHKDKSFLAEKITYLHSHTFTTPSIFVHVRFVACDASEQNYFVGGLPRLTCTNRIIAMVRTSEKRKKQDFDDLAVKIEDAWYEVMYGPVIEEGQHKGKRKLEVNANETDKESKKLLFMVFHPMITAREMGIAIPAAGEEGSWLKNNMPFFQEKADAQGDESFANMLKEIDERDDLKKMVSGMSLSDFIPASVLGGAKPEEKEDTGPKKPTGIDLVQQNFKKDGEPKNHEKGRKPGDAIMEEEGGKKSGELSPGPNQPNSPMSPPKSP